MRRLTLYLLLTLAAVSAQAQFSYHKMSFEHATDCPNNAPAAKARQLCVDLDDGKVWRCEPSAGDCDTAAEWELVGNLGQGTVFVPIALATLPSTSTCATPTEVQLNSGPTAWTMQCTDATTSTFEFAIKMPGGETSDPVVWDAGTVTYELAAIHGTTETITLAGDISSQCVSENETPTSTWGTAQAADISITTAWNQEESTTAAVTPAGTTCAAGDWLYSRWVIDEPNTSANAANTYILGVKLRYGLTLQ